MDKFNEVQAHKFSLNPFRLLSRDWMLITAGDEEKVNTMTASWGGFGEMWGKDVAFVVIRPQRYTKEFIEREEGFSLCFFDDGFKDTLSYVGSVSGRSEDKIKKSNLNVKYYNGVPFFDEAKLVFICKKMYRTPLSEAGFLEESTNSTWYPNSDYHDLYIVEIQNVFRRKAAYI